MTIAGNVDVAKLHTIDNALRQEFISWDRLKVSGIEYSSQPAKLRIATITANSPYARLIIAPDQSTNVSKILSALGQRSGAHPDGEDRGQGSRREPAAAAREHRRGARGQWRRELRRLLDPA